MFHLLPVWLGLLCVNKAVKSGFSHPQFYIYLNKIKVFIAHGQTSHHMQSLCCDCVINQTHNLNLKNVPAGSMGGNYSPISWMHFTFIRMTKWEQSVKVTHTLPGVL